MTPLLPEKNENNWQIDAQESLILFLVLEMRKGPRSDLYWYLKDLPRDFSSILRNFPEKFVPYLSDQETDTSVNVMKTYLEKSIPLRVKIRI